MNIRSYNNIRSYIIFKNIDHAVHTALFRGRIIWSYSQFKDSGIVRSNTNWTIGIHCNYGHCLPRKSKKSSVEEFAILWWVAKYARWYMIPLDRRSHQTNMTSWNRTTVYHGATSLFISTGKQLYCLFCRPASL